jgi:PQQ-dependent catabolism-associated CXXCW motif protein
MKLRRRGVLLAALLALTGAGQPVPEPSGYRMEAFRAPTPSTLKGARVLTTAEAHALWEKRQAVFVDVLPQPPRPPGLLPSTIWRPKPRLDIPGSIWLPDTGYGALAPIMESYLERSLAKASGGNLRQLLVFYCLKDCWMSWNAAKRAMTLGYTRVAWYPNGTDGWMARGYPTELREPEPRPPLTE